LSRASSVAWLESLSPWPTEGFGLERMHALLAELGQPQAGLPAVHVVGTNGKSTTTRLVEELVRAAGVPTGAYLSPHVRSWSERVRVAGTEVDLERVLQIVRPPAERLGATQFETLTAAALVAFREAEVEAAVIEAGLGGRLDATNVLDGTRVVVLTNVALEHTEVLGSTRAAIAAEKLAVARPGCTVVLGEAEWGHNPAGVRWLVERLPPDDYTVMASILGDKDVDAMLEGLSGVGARFVACGSSNPRALPADELAVRARRWFAHVASRDDARDALALAHALGEPVLVTGSLYLLADLAKDEEADR
jgi:dihydrofolate synthase/folylpolyglutamate synthase